MVTASPSRRTTSTCVAVNAHPAGRAAAFVHRGLLDRLHPVAQRFIATTLGRGPRCSQPIRVEFLDDHRARLVWPLEDT